ncbi:MAG: site-specific DNA-methyltransferase [Desulfomonilia bacterium]
MSTKLTIACLPISALKLNPKNPRKHTNRQIRQLAQSIQALGFNVPILLDRDNNVIAGHGRILAASQLGMREVPTIRLEHLTKEQATAFMIADNRLTEIAIWDDALLAEQLKILSEVDLDFSLEVTGFSMGEIDLRIEGLSSAEGKDDPADKLPPLPMGAPVTQPGDLWLFGDRHRLLCGNALEGAYYRNLMNSALATVIFTDPPYNVKINGHVSGLGSIRHREFAMAVGEMNETEFISFLTRACSLMARFSIDGSIHFLCMDWRHMAELIEAGRLAYTELKNLCVWTKDNAGMGSLYRSQHELVFVFKHGRAPHRNNVDLGRNGRYRTNLWHYGGANSFSSRKTEEGNLLELHPTVKPVAMVADAILDCSGRGDIVLDPFLGSGTTLMAAERTGRSCYGMEIDPLYVDAVIRRWQIYTGGQVRHAVSGCTFDEMVSELEVFHAE